MYNIGTIKQVPDSPRAEEVWVMLRMEYIDRLGTYRIYRIDAPEKTVAYETDYYKALAKVKNA